MNATMLDKSYERVKDSLTPETAPGAQDGQPRVSNRSGGMVVRLGSRRAVVGRTQRAWLLGAHGVPTSQGIREWQERGILKKLHARLLEMLRRAGKLALDVAVIDCFHVRAVDGGEAAGPSPVD